MELGWLVLVRASRRPALRLGAVLNLLLVALWVLSRVHGQSVGVVDTLCALDAAALAGLSSLLSGSVGRRLERFGAALSHVAILLVAVSLAALAGGHTHTARAAGPAALRVQSHAFYCRLL